MVQMNFSDIEQAIIQMASMDTSVEISQGSTIEEVVTAIFVDIELHRYQKAIRFLENYQPKFDGDKELILYAIHTEVQIGLNDFIRAEDYFQLATPLLNGMNQELRDRYCDWEGLLYQSKATIELFQGRNDMALVYNEKAAELFNRGKSKLLLAQNYSSRGLIHSRMGDYTNSLQDFQTSRDLFNMIHYEKYAFLLNSNMATI